MKRILATSLLIAMLAFGGANAERVSYENPVALTGTNLQGTTSDLDISSMNIIGRKGDQCMIVKDGKVYYVDSAALTSVLEGALEVTKLPDLTALGTIQKKSDTDAEENLQQALKDLGYLSGGVDGSFGKGSMRAVNAFQEAMGLPVSETVDVIPAETVLLAEALADRSGAVLNLLGTPPTPENKFPQLVGKTEIDLTPFCNGTFSYNYDEFENIGVISLCNKLTWTDTGAADIDSMRFDIGFEIMLELKGDQYVATPYMVVEGTGARRPYVKTIKCKSGDAVCTCEAANAASSVDGGNVIERNMIEITEDVKNVLAQFAETGTMKVRIEGKYRDFEFDLTKGSLDLGEFANVI